VNEQKPQQGMVFLRFLVAVVTPPLAVLLRRPGTCGDRYFGVHAYLSVFAIVVVGSYTARTPLEAHGVNVMVICYVLFLLMHRVEGKHKRARGYRCHSMYVGNSIVGLKWEPLLCVLVGLPLSAVCKPMGLYLCWGSIALFLERFEGEQRMRAITRAMQDARYEQEAIAIHMRREE